MYTVKKKLKQNNKDYVLLMNTFKNSKVFCNKKVVFCKMIYPKNCCINIYVLYFLTSICFSVCIRCTNFVLIHTLTLKNNSSVRIIVE